MSSLSNNGLFAEAVERLREAARTDRSFDAAKVQLINLPEIIASAGVHWPLMKDKIRIGSMAFLRGCLADDDILIPAGDGFLIIFAEGETEALKRRVNELRTLLLEFYLGEEAFKKLQVDVVHQRVAASQLHTLLQPTPAQHAPPPEHKNAFVFAPMWTLRANVIGSYLCTPYQAGRYGYDDSFLQTGQNAHRDYCALDLSLLDAVETALDRYPANVTRPVLGVSIHSSTMAIRGLRTKYLERLNRTAKDKLKFMFVRIAEVDTGTPTINLAEWAGVLRTRFRFVQAEFHYTEAPPGQLYDIGLSSAGFRSPTAFEVAGRAAGKAASVYQLWGASFARQRVPLFVDSVRLTPLIKAAVDAGASFITNDALWPYATNPGGVVRNVNPLEFGDIDLFLS